MVKMITNFLQKLRTFPELLEQEYPEMVKFLHALTDKKGQGSGNLPTNQEASFAVEAQKHGFKFEPPTENGAFIKYQPNGTQKSIDFILIEAVDGVYRYIQFDLKHTNTKTFYWNDGWFENDVIYVISYTHKKQNRIYIGYGEDTPTEQDKLDMAEIVEFKKKWNSENKNTGFLRKYLRFANQYSCDQFTDEFSREKFDSIERRLA
jgi:hypothetical protein